jgi:hypothetical protein
MPPPTVSISAINKETRMLCSLAFDAHKRNGIGRNRRFGTILSTVLVALLVSAELARSGDRHIILRDTVGAKQEALEWELGMLGKKDVEFTTSGNPRVIDCQYGKALEFDGVGDALFLDTNPLAGLRRFTVEVIFRPDSGGLREQRFLHIGDARRDRLMVETRLTKANQWYLDAHLRSGDSAKTLIDSTLLHPAGVWYHLAVVVDNGLMKTYVNGVHELAGGIPFSPFKAGRTSIGVRQNRVYWFRGAICKIRITLRDLLAQKFMKFR